MVIRRKPSGQLQATEKTPKELSRKENSEEDLSALEAFCNQVHFEDVDFAAWKHAHHDLDIQLTEYLSYEEARQDGFRMVSFRRTLRKKLGAEGRESALSGDKVTVKVRWSAGDWKEQKLIFAGQGDQAGQQEGDLIVVLKVRLSEG